MEKITLLLEQKPVSLVLNDIWKLGDQRVEIESLVYQFFIEVLNKSYEFTREDFENLQESDFDYTELIQDIIHSARNDVNIRELSIKDFINKFTFEAIVTKVLTYESLINWIDFLTAITENQELSVTSHVKGHAYLLLSYFLSPLLNLYDPEFANGENYMEAIQMAIAKILSNISHAFQYEELGITCATEFALAIEHRPNIFLHEMKNLQMFSVMLSLDNRNLLVLALKTISNLCQDENSHDILKEYIFAALEDDETIIGKILCLTNSKNLKYETLSTLASIIGLCDDPKIIPEIHQKHIFINVITGKTKKIVAEAATLMLALKVDFWYEVVKMIHLYAENDFSFSQMLSLLSPTIDASPAVLLEVARNHIDDAEIARCAAELFSQMFHSCEDKKVFIIDIVNTLNETISEELTFTIILKCLCSIDHDNFNDVFKTNLGAISTFFSNMQLVFERSNNPLVLSIIVASFKMFTKISPEFVLPQLRTYANDIYADLKNTLSANSNADALCQKLSALLECKYYRILQVDKLKYLYNYCLGKLSAYSATIHRLFLNIVKHLWMCVVAWKKAIEIDLKVLSSDVKKFYDLQTEAINNEELVIEDRCLSLCNILDLHTLFQPKYGAYFDPIALDKNDVIDIVELTEKLVFDQAATDEHTLFHQQMLLNSFTTLYFNYENFPSLTAWEVFLRHYSCTCIFKSEIELIMQRALKLQKCIFEKTVAFAILNLATLKSMEHFKIFYHGVKSFLHENVSDTKIMKVKLGVICSVVLDRLAKFMQSTVKDGNRLVILEFISLIVKDLEPAFAASLLKYVKLDEGELNAKEKSQLRSFENMLK